MRKWSLVDSPHDRVSAGLRACSGLRIVLQMLCLCPGNHNMVLRCYQGVDASSERLVQELFVFQKVDGAWKIARYCFSTTNPPPS